MKKPLVTLAIGTMALIGFAIWGLSQSKTPQPGTLPPSLPQASADAPTPAPPPAPNEEAAPEKPAQTNPNKRVVTQRFYNITQEPVPVADFAIDASKFRDRVDYGDIEGAVARYQAAPDSHHKLNALADLAFQPAEAPAIHAIFLQSLQSEDEETRITAYEAILNYEDPTMLPALKQLAGQTNGQTQKQVQDTITLLEARPMREAYFEARNKH